MPSTPNSIENPLRDWTPVTIRKHGTAGASHTTNLITSPAGQRHDLIDNYILPSIFPVKQVGPDAWKLPGGLSLYRVVDDAIDYSPNFNLGDGLYHNASGDVGLPGYTCLGQDPIFRVTKRIRIKVVEAIDPNDEVGPQGAGAERYISGEEPLRYAVYFENKPEATLVVS